LILDRQIGLRRGLVDLGWGVVGCPEWLAFPLPHETDKSGRFTTHVEFDQPGRYQLRLLDPDSGVRSRLFVLVIKD
jgi:hypothetical protein